MFKFNCLPFGLSSAPRIFSKIACLIVAEIRKMGIEERELKILTWFVSNFNFFGSFLIGKNVLKN